MEQFRPGPDHGHHTTGDSIMEQFKPVPDFDNYDIGNYGTVWNTRTNKIQARSLTQHEDLKVTLVNEEGRITFSVRVLVAEAFVDPEDDKSNTVIVLDNDRTNVVYTNLAWRPRWFAWKYSRQCNHDKPEHYVSLPVLNLERNIRYSSIVDCGMKEGLLFDDIWRSINTGDRIYPTGSVYGFA